MTCCKTSLKAQLGLYLKYSKKLRLIDTFWEDYIIHATIYTIIDKNNIIGCFSIYEKEQRITSFFLDRAYIQQSQAIFAEIISHFSIKCAFVVTNDELFLSLCLDKQVKVENQAYFFDYGNRPEKPARYPITQLKKATESDLKDLQSVDFFDDLDLNNKTNIIYVLRDADDEFLGAGHIQTMRFAPKFGACGMVTAERHRQKGVGRSIILHLTDIIQEKGLIPIAGCWYHNHNSKYTLESCGYESKTRLLNITF